MIDLSCGCKCTMWACPHRPTYTREGLIRVVVAQQWAVAVAIGAWEYESMRIDYYFDETPFAALASLPCAVDVVDGLG